MDTQKIITTFETRKRVTDKALDDLFKIMKWITDQVDNINIQNPEHAISFRASEMVDNQMHKYGYHPEDPTVLEIRVLNGKCRLYYNCGYGFSEDCFFSKSDIDYINLAEAIQALKALIEKMTTIETREKSGNEIARIAALI